MIRLCVTSASGRQRFETGRSEVLLGSREGADLRLQVDGVAPNHCMLKVQGRNLVLVDLGSSDGIRFAGKVVRQATLQAGSAFRIGDALIEVEHFQGAAAPPAEVTPTGHVPDFGTQVRRKLAATPWYGISLVVHAIVLAIFAMIPYETKRPQGNPSIQAVLSDDALSEDIAPSELIPDEKMDEPAALEDEDFEDVVESEEQPRKQGEDEMMPMQRPPEVIGFGQPPQHVRIRPIKRAKKANVGDGEATFDRSNAGEEQKRASGVVAKGIGKGLARLKTIPADQILVVQGEFDEMESVLDIYGIPHSIVTKQELANKRDLSRVKVLCINCGRSPSPTIEDDLVKVVQSFAKRGGWIIASDWALTPYLTGAFPKFVKEFKPRRQQRDATVEVKPRGKTSPLIEGVFADRMRTRWWLEDSSRFVTPVSGRVKVLVESTEMKNAWGNGNVAIEFRPSREGRVVFLLGHFFQKDGNRAGVVGMHRLVLNFLLEKLRER